MALFDDIAVDENAEVQEQEVRKAQSWIKESGAYTVEIKMFRFKQSDGGANGFVVDMETEAGEKLTYEEWFTTKAGGTTYVGKKDGKTYDLPGMAKLKNISRALTGNPLAFRTTEEKIVAIYDFNAKTDVDKKVDVAKELIGKTVEILVQRTLEDKTKLNPVTGKYEGTAEFRAINEVLAWIDPVSHKTFSENAAGKEALSYATFQENIAQTPVKDKRKTSAGTDVNAPKEKEDKPASEEATNAFS